MSGARRWPLLAAIATLAIHLAVAAAFELPGQFRKYTLAAEQHLAGELPSDRLMDLSPFYFDLAVAAARLAPRADPVLAGLQLLLTAAAAGFLTALLAGRFSRPLAAAGVVVFAFDRHVLVYERILEPEALLLFLVLGWICFVERTVRDGERSWRPALVAGLLAGASLMTRPTFLPIFLLVPLYLRSRRRSDWRRPALAFGAPVVAAFLLLALRAAAITGDPRTPVMNPGTVFYEGNQPLSGGTSAIYPPVVRALMRPDSTRPDQAHELYRRVARAAVGRELSISEVNGYWSGLALGYIGAERGRFLGLVRDKLIRVFHAHRWHDVPTAWHYDRVLGVPTVPFAALAALALLGLLFEARRLEGAFLFYLLAALQMAVMLVFYVSARQRLVLLPALIYFALVGLEAIGRERRRRWLLVVLAVVLAACFALPNERIRDHWYLSEGHVIAQGRMAELREATRSSPMTAHVDLALETWRHSPWVEWVPAYFPQDERTFHDQLADRLIEAGTTSASASFDLGVVLVRAGRLDEASALFERLAADGWAAYRGAIQASDPRFYLARIEALRGRRARAVELLGEALESMPGDPFVLAELRALTGEARYWEALEAHYSVVDARYLLGRSLLVHGRPREAAEELLLVVERLPEFRTARIYLAAALGEAGEVDEGAAQYLEAVRREVDPLLLSRRVSALFRRWAERHPDDPRVRLFAAHVLHEHGRLREALAILETIEPPAAMRAAVERESGRVRRALDSTTSN